MDGKQTVIDIMNTIKIAFVDFWKNCDIENHIICKALRKIYDIKFVSPENADYVFFSVFGDSHWFLPKDTIKIFYTGENLAPDFNVCDYAIGFDWITIGDRYLRVPNYYATDFFYPKVELMQHKHELENSKDYFNRKFCSFVVSNDAGNPVRRQVFEKICEYRLVDSGGRWLNNIGGPVEDKLTFDREHKFSICFENSSHPGYTTEKIVEAFAAQTIPIYWGDPEITKVFNSNAFICFNDFDSLDDLRNMIEIIDENENLYMDMLSSPAMLDDNLSYSSQFESVVEFLKNIVDQPKNKAKRYNRDFWGGRYHDHQKDLLVRSRKTIRDMFHDRLKSKFGL